MGEGEGEGEDYSQPSQASTEADELFSRRRQGVNENSGKKSRKENSRRFSDEQIRSLESIFTLDTKLEPRKKVQTARELGLEPRQVAIWFQNRRARWKSKRIEQEYKALKADFESLTSRFQSLEKEKHALLVQLKKIRNQLEGYYDGEKPSTDCSSENRETNLNSNNSEHDQRGSAALFERKEEANFPTLCAQLTASSAPPENWGNLELDPLFTQSCGTSNWWDFWT